LLPRETAEKIREDLNKNCVKMGLSGVRICVRKIFQNLLKLEKIEKCMRNYIK
jgi:hypothetical protein